MKIFKIVIIISVIDNNYNSHNLTKTSCTLYFKCTIGKNNNFNCEKIFSVTINYIQMRSLINIVVRIKYLINY